MIKLSERVLIRILCLVILPFLFEQSQNFRPGKKKSKIICTKDLSTAFVEGKSKCLPNKVLKTMNDMNLLHLVTTSGIHLAIMLKIISFGGRYKNICLILLSLATFLFEGYFAFKRMIWIKLLNIKISLLNSFILISIFDYYIGSFQTSPLSFIYSFIFLAILLTTQAQNNLLLCIEMMGGQILISSLMSTKVYILSFLSNFFIIPLFGYFFPAFILKYLTKIDTHSKLVDSSFEFILNLVHSLVSFIPQIKPNSIIVLITVFYLLNLRVNKKIYLMIVLLPMQLSDFNFNIDYKKTILEVKMPKNNKKFMQKFGKKKGVEISTPDFI